MRVCKSLGELRNMQCSRAPCPQQIGTGTPSRQRAAPSYTRLDEYAEGRDPAPKASGSRPLFRMDVMETVSDSSGQSLESVLVVFEDGDRWPSSWKDEAAMEMPTWKPESAPVPIPTARSQLTTELQKKTRSTSAVHGVARSEPVPVPKQRPFGGGALERTSAREASLHDTDGFVPPHVLTDRRYGSDANGRGGWGGMRGLSCLRARNAVMAQLGYWDGSNETHRPPQSMHLLADTNMV